MEIEKIEFRSEDQFHMIRHFENIDSNKIDYFFKLGYKIKEINEQLNMSGSRFCQDFAQDIPSLLKITADYGYQTIIGLNGNLTLSVNIPKIDFPQGIGTLTVIPITELSNKQENKIFFKLNRGTYLPHLHVKEYPKTYSYSLIINKNEDKFYFITAFPGEAGMPIPNVKMEENLYNNCQSFWRNHVFLLKN